MHKILQNHLLCTYVTNLKIGAIYALYPISFCNKNLAIRKVFVFSDSGLFVGKTVPSLLMEFCQNLNNAKLLPVFQNFILLTNLNLKQKFKWGFILYRGSCDKVVSSYIFHARLGSYIIFAKISIQIIYYSKYSP